MTLNIKLVNGFYIIGSNVTNSQDGLKEGRLSNINTLYIKGDDGSGHAIIEIGHSAFHSYTNLISVHIEPSIEVFGPHCFHNCNNLVSINIPITTKYIRNNVFDDCSSLKYVTFDFPSSVITLGFGAFNNCFALEKIILPPSIKNIESQLFSEMTSEDNNNKLVVYSYITSLDQPCNASEVFRGTTSYTIYVPTYGPRDFCGAKTSIYSRMNNFIVFSCKEKKSQINVNVQIFIISLC